MSIQYRFEPAPKPLYKVIILLLFKRSKTRDWNNNTTRNSNKKRKKKESTLQNIICKPLLYITLSYLLAKPVQYFDVE